MKTNIYLIDFDGVLVSNEWERCFQVLYGVCYESLDDREEALDYAVERWEDEVRNNPDNIQVDINPVIIKFIQDIKKYEHNAEIWLFTNRSERIKDETLAVLPKSVQKLFNKMMFCDGKKGDMITSFRFMHRRIGKTNLSSWNFNKNFVVIDDKPEYVELGDPGSMVMVFGEAGSI